MMERYEIVGLVADAVYTAPRDGVEARDPTTFAGTAAVLVVVGVLAAWVPAKRAARLDPATVLREG